MKHYLGYLLLGLSCLLFGGCNDTDDVEAVFTGKTWKMTFIALEGQTRQFDFWDGNEKALQTSMDKLKAEGNFTLEFDGTVSGNLISGTFTGKGSVNSGSNSTTPVSGTWNADGESNALGIAVSKAPTESDVLGKAFITGLKNAFRYGGDVNNLYIYYEDGQTTKFMAFRPQ